MQTYSYPNPNFTTKARIFAGVAFIAFAFLEGSLAIDLVSTDDLEYQGLGYSQNSQISEDGRWVVFESRANLLPEDTNDHSDIYLKDRETRSLTLLSKTPEGFSGDGPSYDPSVSADGQKILFSSEAEDLLTEDTNDFSDIFLYDGSDGSLEIISNYADGNPTDGDCKFPSISADGSTAVFACAAPLAGSDTNSDYDIFWKMIGTDSSIQLVSRTKTGVAGNYKTSNAEISGDGRSVVFATQADDILPSDTNGIIFDVFHLDVSNGLMTHVSVEGTGLESANNTSIHAGISGDGDRIAFWSSATDIANNDTDSLIDLYYFIVSSGNVRLVSTNSDGFKSDTGISVGKHSMSSDGRWVTFTSSATNFPGVPGTSNVYLKSLETDEVVCLTDTSDGLGPNDTCYHPSISGDPSTVSFHSKATNLVNHDANEADLDVFVTPGTDLTFDPNAIVPAVASPIAIYENARLAKLKKKLKAYKKKLRSARQNERVAQVNSMKKKIKKTKKAIKKL